MIVKNKIIYKIDGRIYIEKETILWTDRKMDLEKKEAKKLLNEVIKKGDTKSNE